METIYKKSFDLIDMLVCVDLNRLYFVPFYRFFLTFGDYLKNNNILTEYWEYYLILDDDNKEEKPVILTFKNIENIILNRSRFIVQKINFTEFYDEYHRNIVEYDSTLFDPRIIKLTSTILDDNKNKGFLDTAFSMYPFGEGTNDYITDIYINPNYKIDIAECILNNKIEQNAINSTYYFLYPKYDIVKVNIKLSDYMINFLHNINGKYLGDVTNEFNEMLKHYNINIEVKLLK